MFLSRWGGTRGAPRGGSVARAGRGSPRRAARSDGGPGGARLGAVVPGWVGAGFGGSRRRRAGEAGRGRATPSGYRGVGANVGAGRP